MHLNSVVYDVMMVVPELLIGVIFALVAAKLLDVRFPGGIGGGMLLGIAGAFAGELLLFAIPQVAASVNLQHALFGISAGIFAIAFLAVGARFARR